MGEDKQGPPIRAAEQDLQRPLRHVDAADLFAVRRIDQHLAIGKIDIAVTSFISTATGIYFGNGDGTLAPFTDSTGGVRPSESIAVSVFGPAIAAVGHAKPTGPNTGGYSAAAERSTAGYSGERDTAGYSTAATHGPARSATQPTSARS